MTAHEEIGAQKILRIMKLIALLKGSSHRTPQQLAILLETTASTVYRYIQLLELLGFAVDKDKQNRYFIAVWDEGDSPALTKEEGEVVTSLMQQMKNNPLRRSILGKLNLRTETAALAGQLHKASLARHTTLLAQAIAAGRQVVLKKYQSARSGKIADRLVEPFAFGQNNAYVLAYEVESNECKHYKLERIGSVLLTDKQHKHSKQHSLPAADIFGMATPEKIRVQLRLNLRAMLLLKEEYPASEPFVSKQGDSYLLACEVSDFGGIGRFILSNIGEVHVMSPPALKSFVKKKLNEGLKQLG